jgi:hypothetical protein
MHCRKVLTLMLTLLQTHSINEKVHWNPSLPEHAALLIGGFSLDSILFFGLGPFGLCETAGIV